MDLSKINLFPFFPDNAEVRGDVADYYFEVQRFDSDVAKAVAHLEKIGELENTIIVVTGDHGMPFPRCKSNLYDSGTRVPLAIRWGQKIKAGQSFKDFVSLTDLAPTFLQAAGLTAPAAMTGRSLLPALTGPQGRRDLNPQPPVLETGALPIELQPCGRHAYADLPRGMSVRASTGNPCSRVTAEAPNPR